MGYLLVFLILLIPAFIFYCVIKSFISCSKKISTLDCYKFLYENSDHEQNNDYQQICKIDIINYLEEQLKDKNTLNESEIADLIKILESKGYSEKRILDYIKSLPQYLKDKAPK